MQSIAKLSGTVALVCVIVSCSSSDTGNNKVTAQNRMGTFTYSYSISSSSEIIALSNFPAPQTNFTFSGFKDSVLNDNSQLAFYALANDPSSIMDRNGLWFRESNGNHSLLAMRGNLVPNGGGLLFDNIGTQFQLNNTGQVLFAASLSGTDVDYGNNAALYFRDSDGSIVQLARSGDAAPGWQGAPFEGFLPYRDLNDLGEVLFTGEVNLGPDSSVDGDLIVPGIWKRNLDASVSPAVLYGDNAPGSGDTFATFANVHINNHSYSLFEGRAGFYWRHGVWTIAADQSLAKIAFEGDPAPGMNGLTLGKSTTYSTPLMRASLNNNGEIVLFSIIAGNSVTMDDDHAIWLRDSGGNFHIIVREGNVAPQIAPGVVVSALMGSDGEVSVASPKLNNQGQVLYTSRLSGPAIDAGNDQAVWLWDSASGNQKILQSGDSITGLAAGEVVASFALNGETMQLNDNGEVLLEASLAGANVTAANDQALVYYNSTSGVNIFLREGDSMQVAVGDNRLVSDYLLEGRPGINNGSQVLFAAGFSDSDGLFLTSPRLTVPTPPNGGIGCTKDREIDNDDDDDGYEIEYDDNGIEVEVDSDKHHDMEHIGHRHHDDDDSCEVEHDDHHDDRHNDEDHDHSDDDKASQS